MPNDADRNRIAERIRDAYRDVVPTADERQKHLTNIARTSPGMVPIPWRRRQGILEAIVILSVVILVVGGISIWGTLDRGGQSEQQTPVAAAATEPEPTATAASNCQETPPSEDLPSNMIANPTFKDWFGNGGLWLSPISPNAVNPTVPASQSRWFTGGMVATAEWPFQAEDTFRIAGERLDGPTAPFSMTIPHDDFANGFTLTIPEPGCWEITATVRDLSLTIVANVQSQSERPDFHAVIERRDAIMPYPLPSTCGSGWDGPQDRFANYSPGYWIDLDGVSIRSLDGLLWENEPVVLDWFPAEWGEITLDGQPLDGGLRLGYASDFVQRVTTYGNYWQSSLMFGAPGCWELTVTTGEVTSTFEVWVYPAACRRDPGQPLPDACRPPA